MQRSVRKRSFGMMLFAALLATMIGSPVPIDARSTMPTPDPAPSGQTADLASELGVDGLFHGAPGVAGTVDAKAWTCQ